MFLSTGNEVVIIL